MNTQDEKLIGAKYGSTICNEIVVQKRRKRRREKKESPEPRRTRKTWMYLVRPTPELWTRTLPHRTQIIYSMDASIITFKLGLRPGHVVVESGTGSGSLSHHFHRCIAPTGRLYTFEFNEKRANEARSEFERHGLSESIVVTHADACSSTGFATDGVDLRNKADAVFLDLPAPWKVVANVDKVLKVNGRVCSFSPCVEQVQKFCDALRTSGSYDRIETIETLRRTWKVSSTKEGASRTKPVRTMRGHTSYLTFATRRVR